MSRALHILLVLLCFELGVLLVFLPWSAFWERNYFLTRYPDLIPWLLSPYARGAVTGLGVLDILIAAGAVLPRSASKRGTRK